MIILFNTDYLDSKLEELVKDINDLLDEIAPEGKTNKHFTGGYVQQLKNSNQFVAYFGQKQDAKNRDTVKVDINANELDYFYLMLKAKIHQMRNEKTKIVRISMAERKLKQSDKKGECW